MPAKLARRSKQNGARCLEGPISYQRISYEAGKKFVGMMELTFGVVFVAMAVSGN